MDEIKMALEVIKVIRIKKEVVNLLPAIIRVTQMCFRETFIRGKKDKASRYKRDSDKERQWGVLFGYKEIYGKNYSCVRDLIEV